MLGIFFLLWLYIAFYSMHGYQEILIPKGTEQFTASFSQVSNIIPINEDVSQYALLEEKTLSLTIQFTDETDGSVSRVDIQDCNIHTDGYASTETVRSGDLPLMLEEGHTYSVQYWAVCEGQNIQGLSLALYGERVSYRWLQIAVLLVVLVGAVCLGAVLCGRRHMVVAMLLLWCSLYAIFLLSMPMQLREEERSAFGRAYAVSNEWMGVEPIDENGNVYMDDISLRNSGYLVYDVPFYRFWSHIGASADSSRAATVTYQDDGNRTVRTYMDAAAITAARSLGCSYPIVYLSGSLLMGILGLIILGILLVRCKTESARLRILSVAAVPSLVTVLQLHSGVSGLFRPLESTYPWLALDEIIRRAVFYITPGDGNAYLITCIPIAVLGLFLWKDAHKETMPIEHERALLAGMVIASVMSALLRL